MAYSRLLRSLCLQGASYQSLNAAYLLQRASYLLHCASRNAALDAVTCVIDD